MGLRRTVSVSHHRKLYPMNDQWSTFLLILVFLVAGYYMLIRPQRKQQETQRQRVQSLEVGSRILTRIGIYGTVVHLGERQAVIEISPGVEMTIAKEMIAKQIEPWEDEFEYETSDAPAAEEPLDFSVPDDASALNESGDETDQPKK